MNAFVNEGGQLMRHPLEDGSKITDHLVIDPVQIRMPVMIQGDYRPIVEEVRQAFLQGVLFTVICRAGTYRNMALAAMPHEESAEVADAVVMTLEFGEAKFIKALLGDTIAITAARRPKLATTSKRGQVQASTPTTPRGSFAYRHTYGKK